MKDKLLISPEDLTDQFTELLKGRTREQQVVIWENMSMMIRAFKGLAVDPKDAIDKLTNVRNIYERSRYPTFTILSLVTYLRLLYWKFGEKAKSCDVWAQLLAENLIAYKGLGREEYRDMVKAASIPEGSSFFFGSQTQQQQEKKRRFWQRKPKEAETELKDR